MKKEIKNKFNDLATKIEKTYMLASSMTIVSNDPTYKEIINMGKDVIPYLIKRLYTHPNFWFIALEEITKQNPVPKEDRGYVIKMIDGWEKWYKNVYLNK